MVDRFKPQAAFVSPARREGWMIANFDEQRLAEAMIFIANRFGNYPEVTPVMSARGLPEGHLAGDRGGREVTEV